MKWTVNDMPDLTGKIAIVTGATGGLGFEITKALIAHHCHVIMACHNTAVAKEKITALKTLENKVDILPLDLADIQSIKIFCNTIQVTYPCIDLLINNAATINIPKGKTKDGFELIFGTNFFGPFVLTAQLYPALLNAKTTPRIVTVGSGLHKNAKINFDNFSGEFPYTRWNAYAESKLADLLFAFEMDRRFKAEKINIMSVAAHPGYAATQISQSRGERPNNKVFQFILNLGNKYLAQSAEKGALPILYAATASEVKSGDYYGPDGLGEMRGDPKLTYCAPRAYDEAVAKKLWTCAEQLTEVNFLEKNKVNNSIESSSALTLKALTNAPFMDVPQIIECIKSGAHPNAYVFQTGPLEINAPHETLWEMVKQIDKYNQFSSGAMTATLHDQGTRIELKLGAAGVFIPTVTEDVLLVDDKNKLVCWGLKLPFGKYTQRCHLLVPKGEAKTDYVNEVPLFFQLLF